MVMWCGTGPGAVEGAAGAEGQREEGRGGALCGELEGAEHPAEEGQHGSAGAGPGQHTLCPSEPWP